MRTAVVALCLLHTVALLSGNSSAMKRPRPRPRPKPWPRRNIWSSIRRNEAEIKKLSGALKETQLFEQEIGPVIDKLKENVDDMKEGFAAQTMLMAEMKTSMNDMEDSIENLQKIISEGEIYIYVVTKLFSFSKDSVDETGSRDGSGSPPGKWFS